MKTKTLLSIEFEHAEWSWGHTASELYSRLKRQIKIVPIDIRTYRKQKIEGNLIMAQNVTQLEELSDRHKIACRLGGNRSFDDGRDTVKYLAQMRQCGAIIATNKRLFNIARSANKNSFLIPNGINLDKWIPDSKRKWHVAHPVIGFCGNVGTPEKADYKGYHLVKEVCQSLGLELIEVLYKTKQIEHDRMMPDFYYKIDILLHPTKGEGCSNTLMECCGCGVPFITTRQAGYHGELMCDGHDVAFCEREINSVVRAIQSFNSVQAYARMSCNARVFAENHHDIKEIVKQYRDVFKLVLDNTRMGKG